MKRRLMMLLALLAAFSLVATACGDDDSTADEPAGDEPADEPAGDEPADEPAAADLSAVCPSPLVIQTDWFPESEHGALYEMVGDDYTVDVENKVVSGSLMSSGVDTGIDIEVRTGGPAIGFAPVSSHMYTDDSIHLGYGSIDALVLQHADAPMYAVMAPLEKNPQIIMWDPETYPDVESIADLGTEGVTVNVFAGGEFPSVFVAQGIWSADQVDPSYDGSPARFVAEGGAIAQQGFASAEPYTYENVFEEWGKPVAFELLHDAGYQIYSQPLAIKTGDLEELRPCLEQFVPIVQQAVVDFAADPAHANSVIIDAVEKYADFWVYDQALADYSVATQIELGLIGNGPDDIVGNMEEARIQGVIDALRLAEMDVEDDLVAADLFTNEFIDETIGLPAMDGGGDGGGEDAAADLAAFDVNGDGEVRIGIAAAGPRDDGAYYQAAVDAAETFSAENGLGEVIVVDNVQSAEAATELENLAQQPVDIIIVGASEIAEPMPDLAAQYSDIFWYCNCGAGFPESPNYLQSTDNGPGIAYTAGVATGILLRDNGGDSVTMVGCCELGFEIQHQLAFELGMAAVDDSYEFTYVQSGDFPFDFDNIQNATAAYENAVAEGADAIYPYLGGAHQPLVQLSNEGGQIVLSAGQSDVCERNADGQTVRRFETTDLTWDIAVRFDGGDYVNAIFPLILSGEAQEGQNFFFSPGDQYDVTGAVICEATPEQEAELQEAYDLVASGALDEDFAAIAAEAFGG
jgi:basic membrane lipoprotein Med (substrate-binding protein (PBP1-ABC) superfamily)